MNCSLETKDFYNLFRREGAQAITVLRKGLQKDIGQQLESYYSFIYTHCKKLLARKMAYLS